MSTERELLRYLADFPVTTVMEKRLGMGFSDQWSVCTDQRFKIRQDRINASRQGGTYVKFLLRPPVRQSGQAHA